MMWGGGGVEAEWGHKQIQPKSSCLKEQMEVLK